MDEIDLSDLIPDFLAEVREHLAVLESGLLALESADNVDEHTQALITLFRSAHTIKGAAQAMQYTWIGAVAHALEDVLGALRDQRLAVGSSLIDTLLRAVDYLRQTIGQPSDFLAGADEMITQLRHLLPREDFTSEADEQNPTALQITPEIAADDVEELQHPTDKTPVLAPALSAVADDTVRVTVNQLDELLRLIGELVIGVQRAQEVDRNTLAFVTQLYGYLRALKKLPRDGNIDESPEHRHHSAHALLEQMDVLHAEFGEDTRFLAAIAERLEQEVMALRLLPVSAAFAGIPRLVRDLAREHGKEIILHIEGETTELDRRILQGLSEPLLHVVRNAIDHGIESPASRVQSGKSPAGTIGIRAFRQGGQVRIEVTDDGKGISPQTIREAAIRKNLLSAEEAIELDDVSALELIFLPNFSTARFITSTSGRGVGMEIVKTSISKLGGSVDLWTQIEQGTRFSFILPFTLTLAQVLLVQIDDRIYAVPTGSIEQIVRLDSSKIHLAATREHLVLDGESIPLFHLTHVLAETSNETQGNIALIATSAETRVAFTVEHVIDQREVVVKPLGEVLGRTEIASGATLLPDGQIAIVLDLPACLRMARSGARRSTVRVAPQTRPRRRILVVEDTHTTRELERNILIASGYEVETASDGAEGWRKVQAGNYDLVLTDIEMPNMDGFELAERIRADTRFAGVPIVILTSLEQESEKRRGLNVGAQAYLVKREFNQMELLEIIDRLLPSF